LKEHADRVFNELKDPRRQDLAREVFVSLTQLGEKSEDTRRRVKKADLLRLDDRKGEAEAVLKALTDARLVVVGSGMDVDKKGDEMVEVSHEALIRGWPTLRDWLDRSRVIAMDSSSTIRHVR
jgi:Novel STAND NTPase 1